MNDFLFRRQAACVGSQHAIIADLKRDFAVRPSGPVPAYSSFVIRLRRIRPDGNSNSNAQHDAEEKMCAAAPPIGEQTSRSVEICTA